MQINKITIFLGIVFLMMATSCEEVIQLDLKNSEPRVVIEANLNATSGECTVQATKSAGFYEDNVFTGIQGATVELNNGSGVSFSLAEISPGVYHAGDVDVAAGEVFRLTVNVPGDDRYIAETRVPDAVYLDSLKVVRGFGDPRPTAPPVYLVNPKWTDPAGTPNYYRFKVTTNGKPQSGSFTIINDEQFDGTEIDLPLYRYGFSLGDTVSLEFLSIDSVSYAYFNQINDMARPSFVSATPYNPIGNFDNGALGYFGIYHSEARDLVISAGR